MYEYKRKTHYRAKDNPLGSLCGKEPPRYRNITITRWKKNVTCHHCANKLRVFKAGKPKKYINMHPDWELAKPSKLQVRTASRRGVESKASLMLALDKRIATNPLVITGRKA